MYIYCHKDYNQTGSESLNGQAYHISAIYGTDKGKSKILICVTY